MDVVVREHLNKLREVDTSVEDGGFEETQKLLRDFLNSLDTGPSCCKKERITTTRLREERDSYKSEIVSLRHSIADSESERLDAKNRLFESQSDCTILNKALSGSLDRVKLLKFKVKSLKKEIVESSVCCECKSPVKHENNDICSMCHEKWCDCCCYDSEDGECVQCKSGCCTLHIYHSDDEQWDVDEYC